MSTRSNEIKLFKKPTSSAFYARFYLHGREYRTSCQTSVRREAEAFARAWRAGIEAEAAAGRSALGHVPLAVLRDKDALRAREARRTEVYVLRSILGRFDNHLIPFFGFAHAITDDSLEAYVAHRRIEGARGQTISTELECLKRSLRLCRIRGPEFWPKLASDDPDKRKASKRHAVETWRAFIRRLDGEALDLALFALATGLRWAELYRVRAEDVRTEGAYEVLTVQEKVKRSRQREVVLSATAKDVVPRLPFARGHRKAFARAADDSPSGQITLRDCRAAFSTAAGGIDARMADLMMGHSGVPSRYLKQDYERMYACVCGVEDWLLGPTQAPAVPSPAGGSVMTPYPNLYVFDGGKFPL